jgi:sugar O-acyltransferase (sialic acid O-acetyltransferase NeuD family)
MNSLIGSSGHSIVCYEIAILNKIIISGYYSLIENNKHFEMIKYLGNDLIQVPKDQNLFVAIGENKLRKNIFTRHFENNEYYNLIHPNSILSSNLNLGVNVLVSAGAIINSNVKLHNGVIINTGSIIEHDCSIGEFSHIAPGAVLAGNVQIGYLSLIGANSVIKQGVKIGNNVIVGAGTVVLNDVPDNCTIVGNPGKLLNNDTIICT